MSVCGDEVDTPRVYVQLDRANSNATYVGLKRAATAEVAICLPVLMTLTLATIDLCSVFLACLEASRREVVYCLARAAELRDNDTGNHVIRVGQFAGIIAKSMGLPDWFVRDIEMAAQLHDVGKITIPDAILLKPGKLEPEEFEIIQNQVKFGHQIIQPHAGQDARLMRRHVELGSDVLRNGSALMRLAASIAQTHHVKNVLQF